MNSNLVSKWVLLNKDDNFRHFKNRLNVFTFAISFFIPIVVLIDALFNRLWRQVFEWILVLGLAFLSAGLGYYVPIIIVNCYWLYYNLNRVKICYAKLQNDGWEAVAYSNEKALKDAIKQWQEDGVKLS